MPLYPIRIPYYCEEMSTPAISSGVLTLNLELGNVFVVTLTENVTTLNFANVPPSDFATNITLVLTQDATGSRTFVWPSSIKWENGYVPVISSAANKVDEYSLRTTNGGSSWRGSVVGKGFA